MQETEDIVARLEPDRLAVDLFDRSYLTLEFRREVAAALIMLQAELRVRATTIATLRAEVETWQKLYRRAINEANGLTNYVEDRPELRVAEKRIDRIEQEARAAIDAAKADKEEA